VLDSLKLKLDTCQLADQHRLRMLISNLDKAKKTEPAFQSRLLVIEQEIAKSHQACERRRSTIPKIISYPPDLPVSGRAAEIVDLLRKHAVLIVAGDTGSGKTTQLPKICVQAGLGCRGLIGHTQPRRLAAISVANRIAEEMGTQIGAGVGFQVRFNDSTTDFSFLKLMTDGILLAEIQQDRFLTKYEVLIIDEAHERSLNIDFLLGFLKQLLTKRNDLKLIITSATIDVEKFSAHFNNAPIVSVSGRTYPVETRYAPLLNDSDDQIDDDVQVNGIIEAVGDIFKFDRQQGRSSGDVLVFLSSEREIRETALKLRKQRLQNTEILPLYGRLRHSEQLKIFSPHQGKRIVLATNVAETSITVPGINYVIDTGFARISRYSLHSKVQRLPIEAISQASANQRMGRCGRVADGICIRLYSEADFISRPLFTDPEITRTNLASVILRMQFLRLGYIEQFPFLEAPEQKAVNEGNKLLIELNALTHQRELTACGRQMAVLPVDPKYARMLVLASTQACLREVLIIVSALSIQDPREISAENRQQAAQKLAEFDHPDSDFLSFVNLWDNYEQKRQNSTQGQLKRHCKTNFLSFMRMREWREVHRQLLLSCQHLGFRVNQDKGSYSSIHKCMIGGSLNQIASRVDGKNYLGSRNQKFSLFSSSVLASAGSKWIVAGELIETSQTFATQAAKIQPEWVEEMALHLVRREYFEPHWSKKRQEVMAYEKVHLYGLPIIEKSLVSYRKIDPVLARELFITDGLLGEKITSSFGFYTANQAFLASLIKQEEKIRRPDFIVSEREIRAFYQARIPQPVCSTRDLAAWLRKGGTKADEALKMTQANLISSSAKLDMMQNFPDAASIQRNSLLIDYVFEPGSRLDGATLEVPEAMVNQLTQADVDWAVPGIIKEKCVALIKGLPKGLRKNFIPVSGFVDQAFAQMSSADGDLLDSLLAQISNIKRLKIEKHEFQRVVIADHLNVKIRVINESGAESGFSANLEELKKEHIEAASESGGGTVQGSYRHELEVEGLTDWSIEELPEQLEVGEELTLIRYPALLDKGNAVDVVLLTDKSAAEEASKLGLARLFMLRSIQQRNLLRKKFSRLADSLALKIPVHLSGFAEDALQASYIAAFDLDEGIPRTKLAFEKMLQRGRSKILGVADKLESLLLSVLDRRFQLLRRVQDFKGGNLDYLRVDIENQIGTLVDDNFLAESGLRWLVEYPRYLKAIELRLAKAPHMGERDLPNTELMASYWRRYEKLSDRLVVSQKPDYSVLRWMLEEYRVSLFAQALGTRMPVSAKRLDKQFEKLAG
jgi:ATP-dependent helicase HrpA